MVRQLCFWGAGFAAASAIFCWKLGLMDVLFYMSLWSAALLAMAISGQPRSVMGE